jgi:aminobenzoyl-glutamate transport protein
MLLPAHQVQGAGLLLGEYDPTQTTYISQFIKSPFVYSLAVHISLVLTILGITFGIASKKIRKANDVIRFIVSSISEYAEFFLIIFLFSQLTALLEYTNLGEYFVVMAANYIASTSFEGITLIYVIITFTFVVNFFMPLSIDKWAYMAPAVIPAVMDFSFTPSLGQLAFLIGDTTANILTPFMPYTIFAYSLFRVYGAKTKQKVGIGTGLSLTLPFALILMFILFILLALWVTFILPLGEVGVFQ